MLIFIVSGCLRKPIYALFNMAYIDFCVSLYYLVCKARLYWIYWTIQEIDFRLATLESLCQIASDVLDDESQTFYVHAITIFFRKVNGRLCNGEIMHSEEEVKYLTRERISLFEKFHSIFVSMTDSEVGIVSPTTPGFSDLEKELEKFEDNLSKLEDEFCPPVEEQPPLLENNSLEEDSEF